MTRRQVRKTLVAAQSAIRGHAAEITRAMGGVQNPALTRARDAIVQAQTEVAAAIREWDEQDDAERTPVQPIADLVALRGHAARVDEILREGSE